MFFRRNLIQWCLGSIAVIVLGSWLFPMPGQERMSAWQAPTLLAACGALAFVISLSSHLVIAAWHRMFGPRRFEGLSSRKSFGPRVLEDARQVFVFLLVQGAFGSVLRGVAVILFALLR